MLGTLHTSRLSLRDVRLDDAQEFFQLDQDAEVMRFLGGVRADQTVAGTRAVLAERIARYASCPGLGLGSCFLRASAEFIGWFMLRSSEYRPYTEGGELLEPEQGTELGYRLARGFWGQGYATEMSTELVRHGFAQLALPQIVGFVDAGHLASARVLQKAGLSSAGRARYATHDVELYRVNASSH